MSRTCPLLATSPATTLAQTTIICYQDHSNSLSPALLFPPSPSTPLCSQHSRQVTPPLKPSNAFLPCSEWKPGSSPQPIRPCVTHTDPRPPRLQTLPLPHGLVCSCHDNHRAVPQTPHIGPSLRAFALTVPSAWNDLPPDSHMDGWLPHLLGTLLKGHQIRGAPPATLFKTAHTPPITPLPCLCSM